jgi:glyoxylase-like metal-dependent hydrolase (beta-lactamase superfamily II)
MLFERSLSHMAANFSYLVGDPGTKKAAVVDPSFDGRPLQKLAGEAGYEIAYVLTTHHHVDHSADAKRLAKDAGAKTAAHKVSPVKPELELKEGDVLRLGEQVKVGVLHTPGHTEDSVTFQVKGKLLTGDTLFVGSFGRVDLPDSDPAKMWESLQRIAGLEGELEVCPGHDYGPRPVSTVDSEKRANPVYRVKSARRFVDLVTGGPVEI